MNGRLLSSTTYPILFKMVDSTDHITPKTDLSPTVLISKNGGSFASASGAVSQVGNGVYALAGNATDRNTLGELVIYATATGADPVTEIYSITDYDPFAKTVLGGTQGAITWAQQKIVANVASQGALDIQNSSTSGYGILSKGYTGAFLEGNINSTAGTGLFIRGNGGVNIYGKNPTYGGVVIYNGNNTSLELCTNYHSINAKNNVRGFDPEIVNQIQESLTEAVEPLASIPDDLASISDEMEAALGQAQSKAIQLPPEEGE